MLYENTAYDAVYRDKFLFGASYAPYALGEDWPMEEWEPDLLRMKQMQFNTVRIFIAWSRIEVRKDQYDFSKPDALFDLAEKLDIQVIVNFGGLFGNACGCSRPWYLRDHDNFCNDDPYIAGRADLFMRKVIERYRERDNLVGWMTWNEPNNMAHCTCEHTLVYFRNWLRDKYGSIEALNKAWEGGEPVCFEDFDQIRGSAGQGIAARLDMERFQQWNLARRMKEIHNLALELDPRRRFTVSNLVHHLAATEGPSNSMTYGLNFEQAGEAMTMMGVSCYITEHYFDPQPAWEVSYKMSRLRTASCDVHRRMLLLETGAGPNIRQLAPDRRTTLMWQMIAHNVKGILMWNYRSRVDGGQVALFQMMAFDGSMTERGAAVAELNARLQKNARLLNSVFPAPRAAVLTLEDSMLLQGINYGIGAIHSSLPYERIQESRFGAYKLLWDMNINADCVTESRLCELSRYKVVLLPAQEQMTEELACALRAYVAQGGTIIAEGPLGFRNREGRLIYRAPGCGMDEVFGCWLNDRQKSTVAPAIVTPDGTQVPVCDFFSVLHPTTARVVCRYSGAGGLEPADGKPGAALTVNRYGKGTVVCAGTEIFRQYAVDPQAAMSELMMQFIRESGIQPEAWLEGETADVEVTRLTDGGSQVLYLLSNHSDEPKKLHVRLRECAEFTDIFTGSLSKPIFDCELQPWQTLGLCTR